MLATVKIPFMSIRSGDPKMISLVTWSDPVYFRIGDLRIEGETPEPFFLNGLILRPLGDNAGRISYVEQAAGPKEIVGISESDQQRFSFSFVIHWPCSVLIIKILNKHFVFANIPVPEFAA